RDGARTKLGWQEIERRTSRSDRDGESQYGGSLVFLRQLLDQRVHCRPQGRLRYERAEVGERGGSDELGRLVPGNPEGSDVRPTGQADRSGHLVRQFVAVLHRDGPTQLDTALRETDQIGRAPGTMRPDGAAYLGSPAQQAGQVVTGGSHGTRLEP